MEFKMRYICIPAGELETNCYLVFDGDGRGAAVDPGGDAPLILDAIKKYQLKISHVLLTHVHFDHILAAGEVLKATGADLLVPRDDERALSNPALSLLNFTRNSKGPDLKADRLLDDGDEINAGKLVLKVLHTPGHTPGSSCYLCGGLLFSGDTLFECSAGRTDFPGGDSRALLRSLKRLSELEGDYTVLPGHGPSTTLQNERRGNPYMNAFGYDSDH